MRMTLRQLQVFQAVCETRSYSKAASLMALTQPAVSLQIRQLEELIDQPLFDYVSKKLYLTPAAEVLLKASEDLFARMEDLDKQLTNLHGALQGQLNLAVESSAQYFAPHLFAAFKRHHPEVSLQLTVVNRAQVIERMSQNRDNLVVMSLVPNDMALEFLPFLNNPIICVASSEHPLASVSKLTLRDLEQYPLLVREQGSGTRKACEEFFQQKRVHFTQLIEISSLGAQREAVLAGLGLAMLPRHAVSLELSMGILRELSVLELPIYRSWCLVHPRGKRLSPVAQAFNDFIRVERGEISALAMRFGGAPHAPLSSSQR